MTDFEGYIKRVKEQLTCNTPNSEFITYEYSENQVDDNLEYFRECMQSGLSPYKSLLFFDDYLNEK